MDIFLGLFTIIFLFYALMLICFFQGKLNAELKVYTKYDIVEVNTDLNNKNNEEIVSIFAKNVITRQLMDSSSVNWGREKIVEKDEFGKYLMYIEYSSKNAFGVNINNSSLICIKLNEDQKTFSYRKKGSFIEFGRVENLNEITVLKQYKKYFSFGEEVLYQNECDERYKIKYFFKWINSNIKKIIEIVKTNRIVDAVLILFLIVIGWNIIKNIDIVNVPNLVGKTVAESIEILENKPLEVEINSTGNYDKEKIVEQWPNDGKAKINECITITTEEYKLEEAAKRSIIKRYNISPEVQQEIIKNWNKISGYGTTNLNRVILDVTRGWMYLTYTNTANNGLYVYSDRTCGAHFGNEYNTIGLTYREQTENMYSTFLSTWPEQYKELTRDEFINLLEELR